MYYNLLLLINENKIKVATSMRRTCIHSKGSVKTVQLKNGKDQSWFELVWSETFEIFNGNLKHLLINMRKNFVFYIFLTIEILIAGNPGRDPEFFSIGISRNFIYQKINSD